MTPLARALLALVLTFPGLAHAEADAPPPARGVVAPKRPTPPTPPARSPSRASPAPAPSPSPPPAPKPLPPADLELLVRRTLAAAPVHLPRGVSLVRVTTSLPVVVPLRTTTTTLELTPPPRRAGAFTTTAVLVFHENDAILARAPVTLQLLASKDATPEVPKGTPVVLVVKRDAFEISTPAVTSEGGDVGEVVSVLLRASGRTLRAQLAAHDRAIAVEDPR